jgi:hypothetical protein
LATSLYVRYPRWLEAGVGCNVVLLEAEFLAA